MSRRLRSRRRGGANASIDMNSLIDLTFLLLVVFIVTLPALEQGVSIMLPQAKTDQLPMKERKAYRITVDKDSRIFLNETPVTIEDLRERLTKLVAEDAEVPVHVRGDERVDYGNVMQVVEVIHKCGVKKMAMVTVEK